MNKNETTRAVLLSVRVIFECYKREDTVLLILIYYHYRYYINRTFAVQKIWLRRIINVYQKRKKRKRGIIFIVMLRMK